MKKDRMKIIIANLIDYLSKILGYDDNNKFYNVLEKEIGMTDNEIDYFSGSFSESDFDETDVSKESEYYIIICGYCIDGESGIDVISIKESLSEAEKVYKEQLNIEKKNAINNSFDTIEEDELSFSAYINGEYSENHIDLFIQKIEQ